MQQGWGVRSSSVGKGSSHRAGCVAGHRAPRSDLNAAGSIAEDGPTQHYSTHRDCSHEKCYILSYVFSSQEQTSPRCRRRAITWTGSAVAPCRPTER